jgi:hypothetical protein
MWATPQALSKLCVSRASYPRAQQERYLWSSARLGRDSGRRYLIGQFPLTGSGKIQKYLLRAEAERLFAAKVSEPSHLTPAESLMGR